jgi:prepilin-type N-terminal cleavage/methylation domain-containing protein
MNSRSILQVSPGRISRAGFSLVEVLVAVAVFSIVLVVVLSLSNNTAALTNSFQSKIEGEAALRQVVDRMSTDFSSAIARNDLPPHFVKQVGNDEFYFHAATDGYLPDGVEPRGISTVGYRVKNGELIRGASGTGWDQNQLQFATSLEGTPLVDDENHEYYDSLGRQVFRMELEFLTKDGTFGPEPPENWDNLAAVVVNLASIDSRALGRASLSLEDLGNLFPDTLSASSEYVSVIQDWASLLQSSSFFEDDADADTKRGIHLRQRLFPVR